MLSKGRNCSPAAATAVTPTSPPSTAATSPLHHRCFRRIAVSSALVVLVSAPCPFPALAGRQDNGDVIALTRSAVNSPHPQACVLPQMGCPTLAPLPLTSAGFSLDTSAALHYKKPIHRRPLTAAWRGDGAADGVHEHDVAISLYAPGLGTDPTRGPSLCACPA